MPKRDGTALSKHDAARLQKFPPKMRVVMVTGDWNPIGGNYMKQPMETHVFVRADFQTHNYAYYASGFLSFFWRLVVVSHHSSLAKLLEDSQIQNASF